MSQLVNFLKSKKYYVVIIFFVLLFFLLRIFLLNAPKIELTYTVSKENLVDTVQVSGTYTTASQIPVTSPANGVIDKLFVANNAMIKKGDPLFHIQSSATADQQKTAYANFLAANSLVQADNANLYVLQSSMYSSWKKYTDLSTNSTYQNSDSTPNTVNRVLPEFTTAQDNWLAAEANYKNQQSVIAKDQAALSAAQQAYAETQSVTLTAPLDGTVVNLLAHIGDQVSANLPAITVAGTSTGQTSISSTTLEPILVIANLSNPYLTANISEDYATRVSNGQKASIVFDALKDKIFSATVENLDTVGTDSHGVITYRARIAADTLPAIIKPGMTALITIETLRKDNVIDVPKSALISLDNASYVEQANTHRLIPVMFGTKGLTKTEIINGLTSGMVIVADPSAK